MSGVYLDGYKDGSQCHSWQAQMFMKTIPPLDIKLSYKQIKEHGFVDWLGKEAPKLDYYILRQY